MQAEQILYWSGMTDTEHSTSGSNEEELDLKMAITDYAKFSLDFKIVINLIQ